MFAFAIKMWHNIYEQMPRTDTISYEEGLFMANTLVQFRTEETVRVKAANICEKLGIDLPTYLRMCISRLVQENGIPFSMKVEDGNQNAAIRAMQLASKIAEEKGVSEMTLDEINAEIALARKEVSE